MFLISRPLLNQLEIKKESVEVFANILVADGVNVEHHPVIYKF